MTLSTVATPENSVRAPLSLEEAIRRLNTQKMIIRHLENGGDSGSVNFHLLREMSDYRVRVKELEKENAMLLNRVARLLTEKRTGWVHRGRHNRLLVSDSEHSEPDGPLAS